ncbi:MAG: multifunctional CCA addition/repair protein [Gammaproteobacteria bacterium]
METYLVGGAVRDALLGLTVKDRDWVVVGASPEELESLGYRRVGKSFPVFLHPQTNEEYALARTERKTGPGYSGFSFDTSSSVTLEEDLKRRDLTINAIAQDERGALIDPFNGRQDLKAGILRHVSDAFVEDPLRVLRICRFAARFGFSIAPETQSLMREIVASGELEELSAERIWLECHTALSEDRPQTFIRTMRDCGALNVILPEIDCLFGVPQPPQHHPEIDTGEHICLALEQTVACARNTAVRFAVLVHDVGKGLTPAEVLPKHVGHEQAGVPLVEDISSRLRVPKDYRELAISVTKYHLKIHRARSLRADTLLELLEKLDAFRRPERLNDILAACHADATGRTGLQDEAYHSADYIRAAAEAVRAVSARAIKQELPPDADFVGTFRAARTKALTNFIERYEHS